ncbi:ROK family protein [Paenibacillus riograndensis]|uniref:ROK family protein n=1 Tax=Paenibacillus riograndensis TaxID=483937 RepID=UPI0025B3658F|nr:ROK family protein [Paenibacillus riograndensis]
MQGACPFHHNCLEGMAAGPTIEARLKQKGNEIDPNHEVWSFLAHYLAQALYAYTVVLSPDIIILGGGVMQSKQLLPKVRKELVERIANYVEIPPIDQYVSLPVLGDTGISGGLLLAIQEYERVG